MTLGKGEAAVKCLTHYVMVNAETNVPGVSADSCHHESGPAKLVPRIHVCAFQQ